MQSFFPAGLFKERRFFYVRDTLPIVIIDYTAIFMHAPL